jgi:hypothetical protein
VKLSAILPNSLWSQIEERSATAAQDLATVELPPGAGVVLAGSQREDIATPVSDIDLVVLLEGDESLALLEPRATVFRGAVVTRYLLLSGGIEVDIESTDERSFAALMPALTALHGLGADAANLTFPILQFADVRLVSRLVSGTILAGNTRVSRWRDRVDFEALAAFWTASNFISSVALLEDGLTLEGADTQTGRERALLATRSGVDNLLLAALAAVGEVRSDLKALPRIVGRLSGSSRELPAALLEFMELCFPPEQLATPELYPLRVLEYASDLFAFIEEQPHLVAAARFIRRFGDRQRWALPFDVLAKGRLERP